jgi:hypothetical protein
VHLLDSADVLSVDRVGGSNQEDAVIYHKPKRCHTGEAYGAITVGRLLDVKESRGTILYEIRWSCCERDDRMSQSKLNINRRDQPRQCIECRRAGRIPHGMAGCGKDAIRSGEAVEFVETPWGRLQTLHGWSSDAHISRPWVFE